MIRQLSPPWSRPPSQPKPLPDLMETSHPEGAGPTSVRSPRVSFVRGLQRRSKRAEAGQFVVEGPQAVRELLAHQPDRVVSLYATTDALARYREFASAQAVPDQVLAAMAQTESPQGVLAVAKLLTQDTIPAAARLVVILTQAQDPGNAGTILRTADAAGADAVVFCSGSVDPHNGKVVRASAGSLFHVPIVTGVTVEQAVAAVPDLQVLAADGNGATTLDDLLDTGALAQPSAWLFGNEARGMPVGIRDLADEVVRIPIYGQAESLNLGAAAAVALYASARALRP